MAAGSADEILSIIVKLKDEASTDMKKFKSSIDQINNALDESAKKGPKAASSFSGFGNILEKSADASRKFAVGLLAAGVSVAGFIGYGAKVAGDLEASEMGFKTLLGSAKAAGDIMAKIKQAAKTTPFEIQGLTTAVQMMSSVTHNGDKALKVVLDIGEGLSAMGKGQAELDRVAVNLQQIGALGKASAIDIKQFAYAGLPIYDMLKEKTGLAGDALAKFTEEGHVTFDLLAQMFDEANNAGGRFFGGFANQSGTFNQLVSNMKDSVSIFMSDLVKESGAFDEIKKGIKAATDFLTEHKQEIINFTKAGVSFLSDNVYILAGAITGALLPAMAALLTVGGGWVAVLAVAGGAVGYLTVQIQEQAAMLNSLNVSQERGMDIMDQLRDKNTEAIGDLERKKELYKEDAQIYIASNIERLNSDNQALEATKKIAEQKQQIEKLTHLGFMEILSAKEWERRQAAAKELQEDNVKQEEIVKNARAHSAQLVKLTNSEMNERIKLGEKEYDSRVTMMEKAKVTEQEIREEILRHDGVMSQKEVSLMAAKLNAQLRLAAAFKDGVNSIFNTPIIQQIKVAFSNGDSPIQKAVSGFKALGSINIGAAISEVGSGIYNLGKNAGSAFFDLAKLADKTTDLTKEMEGLSGAVGGGKGGGGGGAKKALDDAAKAAEKAQKELDGLNEDVKKNWKSYEELKGKVKDALTSLEKDHTTKIKSIDDKIAGLIGNLQELGRAFNMNMAGTSNDIGSKYVEQLDKVQSIKDDIDKAQKEEMTTENFEKIKLLQATLAKEQKALEDHKDVAVNFSAEIAEAQRRNGLTDFDRFMEDINNKRDALQKEYDDKKRILDQEIQDQVDQRAQEEVMFKEKEKTLLRVQGSVEGFRQTWSDAMVDMKKTTQEKVTAMNGALGSLQSRLETVLKLQQQTNTASNVTSGGIPGRASGGGVGAGNGYIVGENGPEYFVPNSSGTIIPNEGVGGGGVTVVINNPVVRSQDDLANIERNLERVMRGLLLNNKIKF